ncbi:hypothetical protein CONLIGDRAFT_699820 [Coniochaeta ligniaria NRRL 30616]|uniref:Uncharacterized protein n=1 Tax=Coniochaeta ligniaria NRRL 30616 TaxID=1408157 RepID=A0A1J7IZD6_9PEZI|nr:hypothetical protein CONLIGDRAFT_699820 [Coniochaeta ligniaria NRRL 30616]
MGAPHSRSSGSLGEGNGLASENASPRYSKSSRPPGRDDDDEFEDESVTSSVQASPMRRSLRSASKVRPRHCYASTDRLGCHTTIYLLAEFKPLRQLLTRPSTEYQHPADTNDQAAATFSIGDYELELVSTLKEFKDAHRDYRTGRALKTAWRKLISSYATKPGAFNFPKFALTRLTHEMISDSLAVEFGTEALYNIYGSSKPRQSHHQRLAKLLDVPDPRMLALWFGADPIQTPTLDTIRDLVHRLEAKESANRLEPADFLEEGYPLLIET